MIKRIVSLTALVFFCFTMFLTVNISASEDYSVSVMLFDSTYSPVTGKISKGEYFYAAAQIEGNDTLNYSIYCAVYNKDDMMAVYKGSNSDTAADFAVTQCKIPETAGDDYYIKVFVWEEENLTPLKGAIAFNASSPYETHSPRDGMFAGREILKDASFENDNMINDGWHSRNSSRISRSTDYVSHGSYSAKISGRGKYYDSVKQNITDALRASGDGDYYIEYNVLPVLETDDTKRNFRGLLVMYDNKGEKHTPALAQWDDLYIYNAVNKEWNSVSSCVTVTLPVDFYNAEFYIETGSGTEDFYVDKCSVRKLISYEEYLRDNPPCDYQNNSMNDYLEIIEEYNRGLVSVYPKNSDRLIKNPYKGLNYYTTKLDFSNLDLTKDGARCSNAVYHRLSWKSLEPEEGIYNFDIIEENIEKLKQYDMMLAIGIGSCLTYNGYNNSTNAQNTPDWLFENYDIPYTKQLVGDGSVKNNNVFTDEEGNQYLKVPVYNNAVFKEKMQNFINAFCERFNDNANIAFVDMRNYGNWGEWHFSSFNDVIKNHSYYDENGVLQTYTSDDFKNLVDMFKNFTLPLAMFTARTEQLTYALDTYNTGIRVDGTLSMNLSDEHRKLAYMDGKNFSVAEWFYQPEEYYEGGMFEEYYDYLPVFIEKVIKEGKPSYISLGYWNPEDFYSRFSDLAHRMANKTGYWFKPSKISYPQSLTDGLFAMTVKNDGVTQLYAGYKRNACVKLALADSNGNILDTVVLNGIDPENWKAGEYSFVTANYSFDNTQNASKLYLGIFSDPDNENPDIKLGIDETDENGWYDITKMTSNAYKSDNKLYKASYSYADYGYGYREPYHAFDNDSDTYWASEIRQDEFLEIDFGEYVNVSQMMLNSLENTDVKYSVVGFDGEYWVDMYNGKSIIKGENIILLTEKKISKLRFVFNENKNDVLKITEIYVD